MKYTTQITNGLRHPSLGSVGLTFLGETHETDGVTTDCVGLTFL